MNVLVIGCGRLGSRLAVILDSHGHDVAVVDENPDSFHNLDKNFNGVTIVGMPMDIKVLRNAGIEGCDAVAVVTPDDNLNITVSEIARQFFGIENVIARISDPSRENVFKQFGLKTVCPTKLAGDAMFTALTMPWKPENMTFGSATVTFHTRNVSQGYAGVKLEKVTGGSGETVFGVVHSDGRMELAGTPGAKDIVLKDDDRVLFAKVID
ncbi:MAG: TrkA family potassium uptake protein [Oscillospiraceae bacterium]|nr:TrkA family potassium uptake protein [Oscillospiraceae bacterium]